jgi:hypothetical protein
VTGFADGTAQIWDAKSGAKIIQLKGPLEKYLA